jgi:sugar lactone lactonase YvrE
VEQGPDEAIYICEVRNHRVLRWDSRTNQVETVVGTGTKGYTGDGAPADKATMNEPYEVRFGPHGHMYVVEMQNHVVRQIDGQTLRIKTVAGIGIAGFSGDGGPATHARLQQPHSIAIDDDRQLYIADIGNHRIRCVDLLSHKIRTVAGNGERELPQAGETLTNRPLLGPRALFTTDDTLWLALREGHSVWSCALQDWRALRIAGTGKQGPAAAKSLVHRATFDGPKGIVSDGSRYCYVVDTENHAIRAIDLELQVVTTIAGTGQPGGTGDGGDARLATLNRPHGICLARDGALYIGDTLNHRVRRLRRSRVPAAD